MKTGGGAMSKPIITEKLVKRSEIKLGNRFIIVEEYAPNLTRNDFEFAEMNIKNTLAKAFGNNEE